MEANKEPVTVVSNSVLDVVVSVDGISTFIYGSAFLTMKQAEYFRAEVDAATSKYRGLPMTYYNLFHIANDVQIVINQFKSVGWLIV